MNKQTLDICKKVFFTIGAMLLFVPMAHCALAFPNINIGMKQQILRKSFRKVYKS